MRKKINKNLFGLFFTIPEKERSPLRYTVLLPKRFPDKSVSVLQHISRRPPKGGNAAENSRHARAPPSEKRCLRRSKRRRPKRLPQRLCNTTKAPFPSYSCNRRKEATRVSQTCPDYDVASSGSSRSAEERLSDLEMVVRQGSRATRCRSRLRAEGAPAPSGTNTTDTPSPGGEDEDERKRFCTGARAGKGDKTALFRTVPDGRAEPCRNVWNFRKV